MAAAEIRPALDGLQQAVREPLDRNNLGRLARMHTYCQILSETAHPADAQPNSALRQVAATLATLLERIILDEVAQPAAALALIPQAVRCLTDLFTEPSRPTDQLLAQMAAALAGTLSDSGAPAAQATDSPPADACASAPAVQVPPQAEAPQAGAAADCQPPAASRAPVPAIAAYVSEPLILDLEESEHLRGFIEESREHMEAIESGLLDVERDPADTAKINELFRPFHTIKGIAGFLNLRDINQLTHEIETILDLGRKNELRITPHTVDRILAGVDLLKEQIASIQNYLAEPRDRVCPQPDISSIMFELRTIAAQRGQDAVAPDRETPKLGQLLISEAGVTREQIASALQKQALEPGGGRKVGAILVEQGAVTEEQVESALSRQMAAGQGEQSIRVDINKLDLLIDAVGELVIAQTMVNLHEGTRQNDALARHVSQVTKIVRDVQETAMSMRMVPIGPTLQKMRRLVRDVSRKTGREVELHISGEETELDKTVIQRISDPLVHMVRNAVDHGIEPPETRRQLGKPLTGNVWLDAYHQGDCIVIEVRDDGRGLDREKLIAKAVQRGLIGRDEQLTDQQAYALIVQPGFSTAAQVTDISGRGVGMDVVKRNVDALRGKIEIQSEPGRGTTFLIRLPLTLAIIDGMIVRVGRERVVVPTVLIEQSLRPQQAHISSVQGRGEVMMVRGELCPLVQLGELFGYSQRIDPCENIVIIVQCETRKIGLVVDELIGQQQVVIKSLAERFKQVSGVSGAAILGDGRVGLILDPTGILQMHNRHVQSLRCAAPEPKFTASETDAECAVDSTTAAEPLAAAVVN